jgi:hypothetical protein
VKDEIPFVRYSSSDTAMHWGCGDLLSCVGCVGDDLWVGEDGLPQRRGERGEEGMRYATDDCA